MRCVDVRGCLAVGERSESVETHLASCPRCALFARQSIRLDAVMRPAVVLTPPADLQENLLALARAQASPVVARAPESKSNDATSPWPQVIAVTVAALLLGLGAWRVAAWIGDSGFAVGDVMLALSFLAASLATQFPGELPIDLSGLLLWSTVAVIAWGLAALGVFDQPTPVAERV